MIKKSAILFASMVGLANAGPFLDLGIGYNATYYGQGCITDLETGCSQNPLGIASAGYEFDKFPVIIQFDHMSSLQDKDVGLNVLSLRYRFE